MATEEVTMNLFPGIGEYIARFTPSTTNDDLRLEFNGDIRIDNFIVTLGVPSLLDYDVNLVYASSGKSLKIRSDKGNRIDHRR